MSGEITKLLEMPGGAQGDPAAVALEQPMQIVGFSTGQAGLAGATVPSMEGMGTTGLRPLIAHDVHLIGKRAVPIWKKAGLASAVVVLLVGVYLVINPDRVNEILVMLGLGSEEIATVPLHTKKKVVASVQSAPKKADAPSPTNIWDSIDNDYGAKLADVTAPLTADQEAQFQSGLDSTLTYQRYKAVLDIAKTRARGTEDMLRQALESKKFWTRMRAIIALADMGEKITDADMKAALGEAHSELRARFFKRFEKSSCGAGCFYIARAALPHLDALGREEVIRVVSREESEIRDVFMVAATFDEAQTVRQAAAQWLDGHSVEAKIWKDVKELTGH